MATATATKDKLHIPEALQPKEAAQGELEQAQGGNGHGPEAPPITIAKDKSPDLDTLDILYQRLEEKQRKEQEAREVISQAEVARKAVLEAEQEILSRLCSLMCGALTQALESNSVVCKAMGGGGHPYNWVTLHLVERATGKKDTKGQDILGPAWDCLITRSTPTTYKLGGVSNGQGKGRGFKCRVNGTEYPSASEACRILKLQVNGDSAVRILTKHCQGKGLKLELV